MASSVLAPTPALCLESGPSVNNNPSNPSDDALMDWLTNLKTGLSHTQACESTGSTSPLYSVSLFALMTTIMTDIERPHYTAISPLPLGTFAFCFTSGSVLHSHEQAYFDDERSWARLGIHMYHASPPAHALLRTPFNSWLFQAPLCKFTSN